MKHSFAAIFSILFALWLGISLVEFDAGDIPANDADYGKHRKKNITLEREAALDVATRFNIVVEGIDCETIFSKPSFGKAYHKSGSVQDYCRSIRPDVVPDYQLLKAGFQNDSEHEAWFIGTIGTLCSLILVLVLIIWGGRWFFRDSSKPDFNHCNDV